jgi:site-specific DNA recombinase
VLFDDTSRLSRNLADVLVFEELMRHYGIKVCFVSQKLDSAEENFGLLLTVHGMVDAQYVVRLAKKVHSAQKGRVLDGYNAGSWPYGYRSLVVENTGSPEAIGRATTKGTMLEVIDSEANVIRRIFHLFADGYSMFKVCVMLNVEKIPSPRNSRSGKRSAEWGRDAVKRILHNEKYRGQNVWNKSIQLEHPQTGQITKQFKPAHEHVRVSAPHLRIVSDELWDRVEARLKHLAENQNARLLGGYNRSTNKQYLYSGMLFCGICGSRMIMGGKVGMGLYLCPNHRQNRGCTNGLSIREDRAAAQITDLLTNQLFAPEVLSHLVSAVYEELKEYWKTQSQPTPGEGIPELQRALRDCSQKVDNLIDVIENTGAQGLTVRLTMHQFEKKRIEDKLNSLKGTRKVNVTADELQAAVRENVANLLEVLKAEVPLARTILQQHVRRFDLFPNKSETGDPFFDVIGALNLFNGPSDPEGDVLLGCSGTRTPQQHTDCSYYFYIQLHPRLDVECDLVEPLCQLLLSEPHLTLEARTPKDWAALLRGVLPVYSRSRRPLGYGALQFCLNNHRHFLEQRLTIIETINPKFPCPLYQLSIRPVVGAADC